MKCASLMWKIIKFVVVYYFPMVCLRVECFHGSHVFISFMAGKYRSTANFSIECSLLLFYSFASS